MEDMPRPRPPYLQRGKSRHGKPYWFVKVGRSGPKITIRAEYGTKEFDEEYRAAVNGGATVKRKPRASKGTLEWAWQLYKASSAWNNEISESTRRQRSNIMKHVLKTGGASPLEDIDADAIAAGIERRAATPSQAKNFKQTMRQFFAWLKRQKIVAVNPAEDAELPKRPKTGGFKEWTEADVVKYEERWPRGTRQRVMLDVYMYTGLRRGDAAEVGPKHVYDQPAIVRDEVTGERKPIVKKVISLSTEKSQRQTAVHLPMLPPLAETLEAGPTGETFIVTETGGAYVKESLGNAFKDACVAAGIMDKSAHGLRKAAATRAADNGATAHELMAIFGWKDIKEAEIYTKAADRKRLALRAMGMLDNTAAANRDTLRS
ncbi:tyrosine-type recombinase/integrase [Bradyrhizobium septentrionale]|uniref:tyrosine-type recombinase/integrase n=1 Tax=Bradyrhizobium septentrionale TaxID=1404411 RepID=UPI0015967D71|nr:tyrosine-type recombinase/integrase [Bradyrhizobium septentrionale]UGY23849.1 tyrosine-type recombinase/integrase [Bradyrhizobium septentrionale]